MTTILLRKGALTRQAILEHAARMASRVGLEGLTPDEMRRHAAAYRDRHGIPACDPLVEGVGPILAEIRRRFVDTVVKPALAAPRGEKRVRALFERWIEWPRSSGLAGCMFVALATELDDQPGPVRERLVQSQKDWLDVIANCVRTAVVEGDFRKEVDPEQFAHELYGIMLANHHAVRLLRDRKGVERTRRGFERLLEDARARPKARS